ncbi:MAG: hypothetical protein Greene101449_75 [Candidatus Peregrinibacteria bacterium Greene1014_49]|nr:MAG: hypothetical protein Greene101449_75 [Candidatus Peregrinibacteria bacterium Greene1014_49]
MKSKNFNHFIVAGVVSMAAAGLVSVNGSALAQLSRDQVQLRETSFLAFHNQSGNDQHQTGSGKRGTPDNSQKGSLTKLRTQLTNAKKAVGQLDHAITAALQKVSELEKKRNAEIEKIGRLEKQIADLTAGNAN